MDDQPEFDRSDIVTIKGVSAESWKWLRDYGKSRGQFAGETVSEIINTYRSQEGWSGTAVSQLTSSRDGEPRGLTSIRGVDRESWRWLKARALLGGSTRGEFLSGLIEWYKDRVAASGGSGTPRKRFTKNCIFCQKIFETNSARAELCSQRCQTGIHRQRRRNESLG